MCYICVKVKYMTMKKVVYIAAFLLLSITAGAQINIYSGANLQGNYSWIRGDQNTFKPGFGLGYTFVYWEYEYWFVKFGVNYTFKQSSSLEYHDHYGTPSTGPDDKIILERKEHYLTIPMSIYFRPLEDGDNAMIIVGTLEPGFPIRVKEDSELYGPTIIERGTLSQTVKTTVGIGAGYQRQLNRHTFLNIFPSFNVDLRADRAFNSITLTAEIIFGVY